MEECNRRIVEKQSETYVGIVSSGQVIKAEGDLVIIGDVNPNGRVVAEGSIYVLGTLKRDCPCRCKWEYAGRYCCILA